MYALFYSMSATVRLTVIGWALFWRSSVVIVLWLNWLGNAAPISPIPEVYSSTHMGTVVRWRPAWWQIAVSIAASVVQISNCVLNVYPVVLLAVLLGWSGQEASVPCWCMACAAPAGQCPGWPYVIELPIMTWGQSGPASRECGCHEGIGLRTQTLR